MATLTVDVDALAGLAEGVRDVQTDLTRAPETGCARLGQPALDQALTRMQGRWTVADRRAADDVGELADRLDLAARAYRAADDHLARQVPR